MGDGGLAAPDVAVQPEYVGRGVVPGEDDAAVDPCFDLFEDTDASAGQAARVGWAGVEVAVVGGVGDGVQFGEDV